MCFRFVCLLFFFVFCFILSHAPRHKCMLAHSHISLSHMCARGEWCGVVCACTGVYFQSALNWDCVRRQCSAAGCVRLIDCSASNIHLHWCKQRSAVTHGEASADDRFGHAYSQSRRGLVEDVGMLADVVVYLMQEFYVSVVLIIEGLTVMLTAAFWKSNGYCNSRQEWRLKLDDGWSDQ